MSSWKQDPCLRNYTLVAPISSGRKWKFRCARLQYLCWSRFHQGCGNPRGYNESSSPWDRRTSSHTGRPGWGRGNLCLLMSSGKKGSGLWLSPAVEVMGIAQAGAVSRICQQKPVQRRTHYSGTAGALLSLPGGLLCQGKRITR